MFSFSLTKITLDVFVLVLVFVNEFSFSFCDIFVLVFVFVNENSFSLTKITLVIQLNPLAPSLSHPGQRIAIHMAVPTIVPHSGSPHDMLTMPIPSICLSVCLSVTTTLYVLPCSVSDLNARDSVRFRN